MIHELIAQIRTALSNEMASSVAIVSAVVGVGGWLLFQARTVPLLLLRLLADQFTLQITITNAQPTFHLLELWLSGHPMMQRLRRVTTVSSWAEDREEQEHALTAGVGVHRFWRQGGLWWISRDAAQQASTNSGGQPAPPGVAGGPQIQTISVGTFGRDTAKLRAFLDDVRKGHSGRDALPVFAWERGGYFRMVARKAKRPLWTVHVAGNQKHELLTDLQRFLASRDWYAERGVPWRRGMLFTGPPGTGKTSLIFALACALDKALYIINPATLEGDAELQTAINSVRGGIVVIEDIDSTKAAADRGAQLNAPGEPPPPGKGLTTSGLLNAIDGLTSQEGRILFITTNHPEQLDAALLRPGRIDVRAHLGLADADIATAMFAGFFPGVDASPFVASLALPMAPAALQNLLLERAASDPIGALQDELAAALAKDAA